jgi:hypothetical protein
MKKLFLGLSAIIMASFVSATAASAHEGIVDLTSSSVSCKGVSIYQDGNYRVSGRCDGLVYPYQTLYNKYVLWGKQTDNSQMVRIAEVDRGYFSGNISNAFSTMMITAEKDSLVRRPSDIQIVTGSVTPFTFDKSKVAAVATDTTSTATTGNKATTIQPATSSSTAGAVVGKIVSSLLVIILVIVGLVIGASLIFRSRGSVSA